MKINKGMSVLLASILIAGTSFKVSNAISEYTCIKNLKPGKTYKYDIDGDKDKDIIKPYILNNKLILNVNGCKKTLVPKCEEWDEEEQATIINYNKDMESIRLYDFNKKDKSYTIVFNKTGGDGSRILKFKNNKCMLDKVIKGEYIDSYDNNTGTVKFWDDGGYGKFSKAFSKACSSYFSVIRKIKIQDYKITEETSASNIDTYIYYKANNTMTAYKSVTSNTKAFTIKKNDKVKVYNFYMSGNNKRIKVKNSSGKYGWIKYSGKQLFKYTYVKCKYGTYHYEYDTDCMCSKLPSSLRAKNYEITGAEMVDDGYGNTDIIGYLRNNSTSTWDYVEVMVTWYDKYGNVIDTTYDNVLNLKPNQSWKFTINTYGDCRKFKITKVTIDKW